jgi:hypothetical protein
MSRRTAGARRACRACSTRRAYRRYLDGRLHTGFLAARGHVRDPQLFDAPPHFRVEIVGQRGSAMRRAEHLQQLRGTESFGRQRAVELSDELVT